jgi:hypothetical protein
MLGYLWAAFVAVGGGLWLVLDVLVKAVAVVAVYRLWKASEREE